MQSSVSRAIRWVLLGLSVTLLGYCLLGFVLVPLLVRRLGEHQLETLLGRRVEIGRVRANPFTLSLTVEDLQVFERDRTTTCAGFSRLYLDGQWVSLVRRAPVLQEVRLDSPWLRLIRFRRGDRPRARPWNVSDLLARTAAGPERRQPPRFSLQNIQLRGGEITVEDQRLGRVHTLSEIQADLASLSTLPGQLGSAVQPALRVRVNGAPLAVQARTRPFQPGRESTARVQIDNLDLTRILPYLPISLPFPIQSARLDARLEVALRGRPGTAGFRLNVDKLQAHVRLPSGGRLTLSGRAKLSPLRVDLAVQLRDASLLIPQPYLAEQLSLHLTGGTFSTTGRLRIESSGEPRPHLTFVGDLEVEGLTAVDGGKPEPILSWRSLRLSGASLTAWPPTLAIREAALLDPFMRLIVFPDGHANLQTPARRSADAVPREGSITVERLAVQGGHLQVQDLRLRPASGVELSRLNGTFTSLSSHSGSDAGVNVQATVHPAGRVSITGRLNPRPRDFRLSLRVAGTNLELPQWSPYIARYLGYSIRRGKLALSLDYRVVARRLSSRNHLRLEKLTLGNKFDSPSATHIPVPLTVSLLTDRRGVIEVDVPINGSLDDPKFKLRSTINQALIRLIARAVTVPFWLPSAVVDGD